MEKYIAGLSPHLSHLLQTSARPKILSLQDSFSTFHSFTMKYTVASLAFALSASAATFPKNACTFTLTASGGQSGIVGQLSDGQNRVGGGHLTGTYSINNGQITDAHGRGCILTPPTTQFQCDEGATPTGGFSISNGHVAYNGWLTFYACPATDNEYNIYTQPVAGQAKCVKIELTASGCDTPSSKPPSLANSTGPYTPPSKPNVVPAPLTQPSGKTCPANLNGAYQYPHLIVPVSKSSPNKAYGTQYNGKVTSDINSIFNFDIPTSYTGTCSLVFLFPKQSQLETSSYTFSGDGAIDFKQLSTVASQSTTYASQGSITKDFGSKIVTPGSSTVVSTFACPAGKTVSYELSAVSGTSLEYFQDYNPSPIGLYITSC